MALQFIPAVAVSKGLQQKPNDFVPEAPVGKIVIGMAIGGVGAAKGPTFRRMVHHLLDRPDVHVKLIRTYPSYNFISDEKLLGDKVSTVEIYSEVDQHAVYYQKVKGTAFRTLHNLCDGFITLPSASSVNQVPGGTWDNLVRLTFAITTSDEVDREGKPVLCFPSGDFGLFSNDTHRGSTSKLSGGSAGKKWRFVRGNHGDMPDVATALTAIDDFIDELKALKTGDGRSSTPKPASGPPTATYHPTGPGTMDSAQEKLRAAFETLRADLEALRTDFENEKAARAGIVFAEMPGAVVEGVDGANGSILEGLGTDSSAEGGDGNQARTEESDTDKEIADMPSANSSKPKYQQVADYHHMTKDRDYWKDRAEKAEKKLGEQ